MKILQVIIVPPLTRVIWDDGVETKAKLSGQDPYDEEKGVLYAIAKRFVETSEILRAIEDGKNSVKRIHDNYGIIE